LSKQNINKRLKMKKVIWMALLEKLWSPSLNLWSSVKWFWLNWLICS